jgi:maltooligosyltrehalose trehalohydrolase
MTVTPQRRLSAGVEVQSGGRTHARVWAPACKSLEVVNADDRSRSCKLIRESDGHFSGDVDGLDAGDRYWFRLDGDRLCPDPVSRFQPDGPHGPSMIVDPSTFRWSDAGWRGLVPDGQVVYEMHAGSFTKAGTWAAAAAELDALADLGITVIELLPIAEFSGGFGWGYDGVDLYAPSHLYGTPDDLRAFIDRAHGLRIGVILDVVYNHVGPDGNYLAEFSPDYFTSKYENDWGQALNFEGPDAGRAFFVDNAGYWIEEFHFDGLRLDATQDIHDSSAEHVIASIVRRARQAAGDRTIYIVAENEPQNTELLGASYGVDALWNDDYHHSAVVALTGKREAYYLDYKGSAQEFISCAKYGYLYQGQWYGWQKQRRGAAALDAPPHAFVSYLENHDQVANTPFGRRLHQMASPARLRAMTALTLLGPATPMLFQGQEFASSAPFLYFADHKKELSEPVAAGRKAFLLQFLSVADPEIIAALPRPSDVLTFERSKLDVSERERHHEWHELHRDLIRLRRNDPVILRAAHHRPDGAVIGSEAFVLRYFGGSDGDRLLIVNLGCDLDLSPMPEPLLAPPRASCWRVEWSSESPRYGGNGTPPLRPHARMHVAGASAMLLRSEPGEPDDNGEENDDH